MRSFIQQGKDFSNREDRRFFLDFLYGIVITIDKAQLPAIFQEIVPVTVLPHDITDYTVSAFLETGDIARKQNEEQLQWIAENDFLFYALLECMLSACKHLDLNLMVEDPYSGQSKSIMGYMSRFPDSNDVPPLGFRSLGITFAFPIPDKLLILDKRAWENNAAGATIATLLNDITNPKTWKAVIG